MYAFDPEPKETTDILPIDELDIRRGDCNLVHANYEKGFLVIDDFITKSSCISIRNWIDTHQEKIHTRWSSSNPEKIKIAKKYHFPLSNEILDYISEFPIDHFIPKNVNDCWRFVKSGKRNFINYHLDTKYIQSVDCISKYTVMIYLTEHMSDGFLELQIQGQPYFIPPREGRLVIFNQEIAHKGHLNYKPKYFMRSEIMFKRIEPMETEQDREAIKMFREASNYYYIDPKKSLELEEEAYKLSPEIERMLF